MRRRIFRLDGDIQDLFLLGTEQRQDAVDGTFASFSAKSK